jgi:transcriptional regulator with GAF, ATPase, and Fis domain
MAPLTRGTSGNSAETLIARGEGEVTAARDRQCELLDLSVLLSHQDDFQEILRLITVKGMALFEADMLSVVMINPKTQNTIKTLMREGMTKDDRSIHLLHVNVIGWVQKYHQPFLSQDLATDPRFAADLTVGTGIYAAMCVPILNGRQLIGQVLVGSQNRHQRFANEDLALLEKCAAVWGPYLNDPSRIHDLFERKVPDDVLLSKYAAHGLLGRSHRFRELIRSVDAAAQCDVRVFLEGPSGSGKELVARAIHALGARRQHPFVAVDCGAIPAGLIESELFGHVKGAFTGASQSRRGLLEEADQGTLFMDEIGNLPLDMQVKLLRVLQEGEVRAVGSNLTRRLNVRIISASCTSAANLRKDKILRDDLFYRLHVYPISIPTLHERREDISLLADHFVREYATRQRKQSGAFHPSIIHFMREKVWKGNVRELENFIERMVTMARPEVTVLDHTLLPAEYEREYRALSYLHAGDALLKPLRESLQEHESHIITEALVAHGWNQSEAARALRISERAIRYKMARLNIERPRRETDENA